MAGATDNRKLGYRIALGAVVMVLGGSMLLYLVPQSPGTGEVATDTVAKVGNQEVTMADVRQQLTEIEQRNQVPKQLEGLYARQILTQLVFQKEMEYEAKRLGISVSDQERADRIRQFLPTAYNGDTFIGMDRYSAEVQSRFQLTVPVFEELIRQGLLEEKFRKLVTDGISVGPAELQDEFRYRNQKVKLDYALIKPEDLESKITPDDAEIKAAYEKNRTKYQIPERRVVRYVLVDVNQIRQNVQVSDAQLKAQYQQNIQQYQVPNRVHVEHILLFTQGKTDAEVAEIRKKAEDILKQAKKGGKFEDLAKKYSEDPGTKDKGGDLGWIMDGQTVPEFQRAAFSLTKGGTSELVKTQFGFHIIRVLDRETARTLSFDEVRATIVPIVAGAAADAQASEIGNKLAAAVRQSNRRPIEELGKDFGLPVKELPPIAITDPLGELGSAPEARDYVFQARPGELSPSLRTDRGYVVLTVKEIQPSRQAALMDVHAKVDADYRAEKAVELVRKRAEELADKAKGGEKLATAAKALSLEAKTSDLVSRGDSISDVGTVRRLPQAFSLPAGGAAPAFFLGSNWVVYRVVDRQEALPEGLSKQSKELEQQLLQSKEQVAYEAFRAALKDRLKREGKLRMNEETLKRLTGAL